MFNRKRDKIAELQEKIVALETAIDSKNAIIRRAASRFVPPDQRNYSVLASFYLLSNYLDELDQKEKADWEFERLRTDVAKIVQPTCIRKPKK